MFPTNQNFGNRIEVPDQYSYNEYLDRMSHKWHPHRPKYKKGIDNDFSNKGNYAPHNYKVQDQKTKQYVKNYSLMTSYKPDDQNFNSRSDEVPRFNWVKSPLERNPTAYWKKVITPPEKLLQMNFRSGKNVSRQYRSDKYRDQYIGLTNHGFRDFDEQYQENAYPLRIFKNNFGYKEGQYRNPFSHNMPYTGTYYEKNKDFAKEYIKTYKKNYNVDNSSYNNYMNYNKPNKNYNVQKFGSEVITKNEGNNKQLMMKTGFYYPDKKVMTLPNYNILSKNSINPVSPQYYQNTQKGSVLDQYVLPYSKVSYIANKVTREDKREMMNPLSGLSKGTKNNIKYLPQNYEKNLSKNSILKARFSMRKGYFNH